MTNLATQTPVATRKAGRPRTGRIERAGSWDGGAQRYTYRVTLQDGAQSPRLEVPKAHSKREASARSYALHRQLEEDAAGTLGQVLADERAAKGLAAKVTAGETADEWHIRFTASRPALARASTHGRGRWNKWIRPHIGHIPMVNVTGAHIELVRDALDAALREGRLSGKTPSHVWSVLTTAFKAACASKDRSLRVLDGKPNPCTGVLPPDRSSSKRKHWVYPSEFLAMIGNASIPLAWRECHAIAVFTYLRPGELAELRWKDVDFEAGRIRVTRAWVYDSADTIEAPKTDAGTRDLPIDVNLAPLLKRMAVGQDRDALVVPILRATSETHHANKMRAHMRLASGVRAELFDANHPTFMPVGLRSWRDTGATWEALRGTPLTILRRRIGHEDIAMTDHYVKQAEDCSHTVGKPFPELPATLLQGDDCASESDSKYSSLAGVLPTLLPNSTENTAFLAEKRVERRGIEPLTSALRTPRSPN
jgi:integrase